MKTQNPVDQLRSFFQTIIEELYEYIEEIKKPDPPPTPRTEPTAFQEFTQELRDNWKAHWIRTTTLGVIESMKKIKENKKKFKLHKS